MMDNANGAPGFQKHPDYRVDLEAISGTVEVEFGGEIVAKSGNAIRVLETKHDPVIYVPRVDVRFEHLEETDHATYCPFKGDARYWSIVAGDRTSENAVWGYDAPYDEVAALVDYVAFYTSRVDAVTVGDT